MNSRGWGRGEHIEEGAFWRDVGGGGKGSNQKVIESQPKKHVLCTIFQRETDRAVQIQAYYGLKC